MKIPLKVNLGFFLTAALIGFINSFNLIGTILWMGIIFVSVLVHEYGHALTAKLFGQKPRIELVAFGGVTIPEGPKLKPWKEFLVIFMGPCFGFLLVIAASILMQLPFITPFWYSLLAVFRFVNLFWTIVNLLPILPLDGGQLVRVVMEKLFGARAWKITLYISLFMAIAFAALFFMAGLLLVGAIFLIFVVQSVETLRRMENYSEADQSDTNRDELLVIEEILKNGRQKEAVPMLERLMAQTKTGIIYTAAAEYLAKICYDWRDFAKAHDILEPIEKYLSKEAKCILYLASYEIGDHSKVVSLSGLCFEEKRTVDIAIRAAASHAMLHNIQKSVEWLRTASKFGDIDLASITRDHAFDSIRGDQNFQDLLKHG
jgi:stage IV sporulation protein FB